MTTATVHDPVCHMDITVESAAGTSTHQGTTYYFCARGCKQDFDEDPAGILKAEAEYDHSQSMDHGMSGAATSESAGSSSKRPWWRFWS